MTDRRWLAACVAIAVLEFVVVLAWLLYANQSPPEHHFLPV